jgi:hypothetical protein
MPEHDVLLGMQFIIIAFAVSTSKGIIQSVLHHFDLNAHEVILDMHECQMKTMKMAKWT